MLFVRKSAIIPDYYWERCTSELAQWLSVPTSEGAPEPPFVQTESPQLPQALLGLGDEEGCGVTVVSL